MMIATSALSSAPVYHRSTAGRGVLLAYVSVLLYASLSPFFGWSWPQNVSLFTWPRYWTVFDTLANVFAYVPFGLLLAGAIRPTAVTMLPHSGIDWKRASVAAGVATLFSLLMELLQACLPGRVSSPLDLLTNAVGALLGAFAVVIPLTRAWLARVERWRDKRFAVHAETDWGLLLLVLWLFAQLNPSIPFFEAGSIGRIVSANPIAVHPYDPMFLLPQAAGIGLNVCGFALFLSLLVNPQRRVALNVIVVLLMGFVAKMSMASLMMKAPALAAWLTPATAMGFAAGLFAFLFFGEVAYRWRALVATLFVFAGGVMAKLTSVYRAFEDTLQLFNWPYGHLATFANLTSWVHEIWPLAAFVFLSVVFIKRGWADNVN